MTYTHHFAEGGRIEAPSEPVPITWDAHTSANVRNLVGGEEHAAWYAICEHAREWGIDRGVIEPSWLDEEF